MKYIICIVLLVIFSLESTVALTPISQRVSKKFDSRIDLDTDQVYFRGAGTYKNDIDYRKKFLPDTSVAYNEYLVVPANGLVIPILETDEDFVFEDLLLNGLEIDFNTYLQSGSVKFTKEAEYGAFGNVSVFGHSSYWKNDEGLYKTHFQKIIELDKGEQIWVYKKLSDGNYKRFIYTTSLHYDTKPENIGILENIRGEKKLTLFTCTPIGSIAGRWVVEALYNENTPQLNLGTEDVRLIKKLVDHIGKKRKPKEYILRLLQKLPSVKQRLVVLPSSRDIERKFDVLSVLEEELRKTYSLIK